MKKKEFTLLKLDKKVIATHQYHDISGGLIREFLKKNESTRKTMYTVKLSTLKVRLSKKSNFRQTEFDSVSRND